MALDRQVLRGIFALASQVFFHSVCISGFANKVFINLNFRVVCAIRVFAIRL